MRITTQAWETYIRRLAKLNEKAAQLMAEYLAAHGTADTEALTDYAAALVQKYGEGSAELACQMYDAMAALQNAMVSPAEPAAPASRREVARMVLATRESPPQMQRGVSRLVKRAGADTTLKNAQRDGAEFAWVPRGDSCAFCLTLASRGWQRASQAAIKGGHAEHIHANCDCEYAIRFDSRTSVAGYDPDAYLAQYNAAGGDINRMRRVNYAANKERINAQKRAAYAARVETQKKDAIIKADEVISGHAPTPKGAKPNSIIDHLGENGKVETRTFYGPDGYKKTDITSHDHGFPAMHPYGKHGEHAHDYEWDETGKLKSRTIREITEEERKECGDFL